MHVYIYLCLAFAYASAAAPAGSSSFPLDATTFNAKVFAFMADEVTDLKAQAAVLTPLFEACKVTINDTVDQCKTCVGQNCQSAAGGGDLLSNAVGFVTYYGNPGNYLVEPLEDAGMAIANFAIKYGTGPAQAIVGAFNSAGQDIASFFEGDVMNALQATLNGIKMVGEQIASFSASAGTDIANAFKDLGSWFSGLGKRRRRSASAFVDAHAISRQKRAAVTQATRDCYNNNCPVCKPFLLETSETVTELCPAAAAKNVSYVAAVTKFQNIFSFFNNTNAPSNELFKDVYISDTTRAVVQATGWFPPGLYTTYVPTNVVLEGWGFVALLNDLAVEYHGRVYNMV